MFQSDRIHPNVQTHPIILKDILLGLKLLFTK